MLGNEICPWTSSETPVGSYSSIPSLGPGFEYENCDQFTNGSNANQAGQYSVQSPFDLSVQGQEVPQYYSEAYESRVANHSASQRVSVIGKCLLIGSISLDYGCLDVIVRYPSNRYPGNRTVQIQPTPDEHSGTNIQGTTFKNIFSG